MGSWEPTETAWRALAFAVEEIRRDLKERIRDLEAEVAELRAWKVQAEAELHGTPAALHAQIVYEPGRHNRLLLTNLKQVRLAVGLSRAELAYDAGVGATTIRYSENQARAQTAETARKLAEALGVELIIED